MRLDMRFVGNYTQILGEKIDIGKNVWVGHYCLLDGQLDWIRIGDNSVISSYCRIYTHDTSYRTAFGKEKLIAPVEIGEYTQIGDGTIILPGVKIGNHVIIGANSLVNKDLPDKCLAAGSPVVIKKYFDEEK